MAFLTFDREVEQYLCAAVLRPGNAVASDGAIGLLRRLLPLLRAAFPRVRFLVRLDGGFATPELFDFLDAEPRLDYVVAMAKNAVLKRRAEPAMEVARAQSELSGKTAHVYTDTPPSGSPLGPGPRPRTQPLQTDGRGCVFDALLDEAADHLGIARRWTPPPESMPKTPARPAQDHRRATNATPAMVLVLHPAVPDPRIHETGYRVGAWRWPRGRFLYGAKSPFFSWTRSPASTPYCETGDSSGERAL